MSANQTAQLTYPVLCIPRAMLFHTAENVEYAFNEAMGGKFVKSVGQSTTTDKAGTQFNVFFVHPDQDFKATRSTDILYRNLREQGVVNISTGTGKYFWKVKLYVPHLKAQYLPKPEGAAEEKPVQVSPRILTEADLVEFREFQRQKIAERLAADKAAAEAREAAEKEAREAREAAAKEAEINRLGNLLYPLVVEALARDFPNCKHPGKITGMILEMPFEEIEQLIADPAALTARVHEAVNVLREHFLREAGVA